MTISFVIVAYNAESSIQLLLDNLKEQDYAHEKIEIILVDSDSSDKTYSIIKEFQKKEIDNFLQIKVFKNPKRILAAGWNIALMELTGDLVLRVDAHSIIPSNFISKNIECIKKGQDITGGRVTSVLLPSNPWSEILLLAENSIFGGGIAKFRRISSCRYVDTLAFACYKKQVFEKVGGYDERLVRTEDNEMHYRMRAAGFKFYFSDKISSKRISRTSIKKLVTQKYLNGYWVGLTCSLYPKAFSVYHFIPGIFVVSIIFSFLLMIFSQYFPSLILWSIYLIANITLSSFALHKKKLKMQNILLPLTFLALHISYGLGSLIGFIKVPIWLRTNSNCNMILNVKHQLANRNTLLVK